MNRNKNLIGELSCEINENEFLHDLKKYAKMTPDVLELIRTLKIEEALKMHPFKITPPKDENGRWQTYVNTDQGRIKVAKKSEKDLYQALVKFYLEDKNKNITLKDFYPEWMAKRSISVNSTETLRRNDQHWKKYYLEDNIVLIPLRKLSKETIEDYFHLSIKKFNLTEKELNNMKIILKSSLELALDRGIITINPFNKMKINYGLCRYVSKKSNKTQVYFDEEIDQLMDALDDELVIHPDDTTPLAVKLLFQMGTRLGELAAIKWSDVEDDNIHIQRMEANESEMTSDNKAISFEKANKVVVDHLKRKNENEDRFIHLTEDALEILKQVKELNEKYHFPDEAFIFCGGQGRTTRRQIAYCIEKACSKAGMPVKSALDIRRTVASLMHKVGIPIDEIRCFLGHVDEKTTWGYIFNQYSEKTTKTMIGEALSRRTQVYSNQK